MAVTRHAILGPGGVGGLIGAVLAEVGHEVTLVVRPESRPGFPDRLKLDSPFGSLDVPVEVSTRVPESVDVLWVTVKATHLLQSIESARGVAPPGAVVPLLNGIDHVAMLRRHFDPARVIPATIAVESERVAPGRIVQKSPFVRLRVVDAAPPAVRAAVSELAAFGFDCGTVEHEPTLLWSKLVFLAPVALSTSAIAGTVGEVLSDQRTSAVLEACVGECCAVAAATGAAVDSAAALRSIRALPPQLRSSMEKDLAGGAVPELDAIGGPIIRGAERHGIPIPATEALFRACARRADRGRA